MKKRPFILIEILIAFMLVAICAIPLVKQPFKLYRDEMIHLENMEKERLADWTFTEIKEILLKNEIPWAKIPTKGIQTAPFSLPLATLEIPGCPSKQIARYFILKGRGEKVAGNHVYRQIGVCIMLDKQQYEFRLPVQKLEE